MAKSIFRYLRGEINGSYLNAIHNTLEKEVVDIKDFFIDYHNQQFQVDKISDTALFNLGKFASIFLPRRPTNESVTSVYMTETKKVDNQEYSERGLYSTSNETFNFYHTDTVTTEDINILATERERSSLVGEEEVLGYISENTEDVLDDTGKVRIEKVSATPPEQGAYSAYYGNNFLFLSEGDVSYETISPSLYLELYKAIQYIRYNGVSLKSLCNVVGVLCPQGLVKIKEIRVSQDKTYIYIDYVYDNSVNVNFKEQRFSLLSYLINLKFKQFVLVESNA